MSNFVIKSETLQKSFTTRDVKLSSVGTSNRNVEIYLQNLLKVGLLEVGYLKQNNTQIASLLDSTDSNHKELNNTLTKFLNNQTISITETRHLGTQLSEFSNDILVSNRDFKTSLNTLNTGMLRLLKSEDTLDTNREQLLSVLSNMDKELETNLRRDDRIIDMLRGFNPKNSITAPEKKEGIGIFDIVKNLAKNPLKFLAPLLTTGGSILGGLAGVLGLKKLAGKIPFVGGFFNKKVPKAPHLPHGSATPNLEFVAKESKWAKVTKGFGKALKPLKMLGRFAGFVGLALTAKDIYDNTVDEFFGKDSETKTMSEKIRNVITKTLSGFISDMTFGLLDSDSMKKAFDNVANTIMSIGAKVGGSIANIAGSIWNGLKSLLPDSLKSLLPAVPGVATLTQGATTLMDKGKEIYDKATGNNNDNTQKPPSYNKGFDIAATASTQGLNETYRNRGTFKFNVANNRMQGTQGNLKGNRTLYGKCYLAVGKVLAKYDPVMDKQLNNYSESAYMFAEYAKTPEGRQHLIRVSASKDSPNLGIEPGDVIVYPKNYERDGGHKHGHIEIMGNDGNTYSDYTDVGATTLHRFAKQGDLDNGFVKVFRLKGASQKLTEKQKKAVKNEQITPSTPTNPKNLSAKDRAIKGITQNETGGQKGVGYKISHAIANNSNFSFGNSQFDIGQRPDAWKRLGFNDKEIKRLQDIGTKVRALKGVQNLGADDKAFYNEMQRKMSGKNDIIDQLDKEQNEGLYKNYLRDKNGGLKGIDVSDPKVMAQMMDIYNQYGDAAFQDKKGSYKGDIAKLVKYSKGNKITVGALKQWRLDNTKMDKTEQMRRYDTVNAQFEGYNPEDQQKDKMANKTPTVAVKSKEIAKDVQNNKQTKETANTAPQQAPVVVQQASNNTGQTSTPPITGIMDENLILVNLGLF